MNSLRIVVSGSIPKVVIAFMAMVTLYACAPAYIPTTVNTPLFKQQGDVNFNVGTGSSGFDPQVAIAISDHIGLMVNASFQDRHSDSTFNYHVHRIVEGGIGYYTMFSEYGRFEIYGGYGLGRVKSNFDIGFAANYANAEFHKMFLQPSMGLGTDYVDFSFTPRLSFISMYVENATNFSSSYRLFFEPVITSKIGYRNIKLVTQAGLSIPAVRESELPYEYRPLYFTIGLQLSLSKAPDNKIDQGK